MPVSSSGYWVWCPQPAITLNPGDHFKVNNGSVKRKFTVPDLAIVVDRVANDVHGNAPAGNDVSLEIFYGPLADSGYHVDVTADSNGHWAYNDDEDIDGNVVAYMRWTSAKGDQLSLFGVAPQILITIGDSDFTAQLPDGLQTKIVLRDGSTDAKKGKATTKHGGYIHTAFRNSAGYRVAVAAGDHIVGTGVAADLDWYVPDSYASANVATDRVTGYCEDRGMLSGSAIIRVFRTDKLRGTKWIGVNADGTFSTRFSGRAYPGFNPANIKHGDRIEVSCELLTGDYVAQSFMVS